MGSLVTQGANALAAYGGTNPWAEAGRGAEQGVYLKFNGNSGDMEYGSDATALPEGSLLVFDMSSYSQGWTCWKDGEPVEEVLVAILDGKPPRETELTDHGPYDEEDDGWREAASISAVLLEHGSDKDAANHEDVGLGLLFKTSTGGAVKSLKRLCASYGRLFMTKPGQLPIVEVTVAEYAPKNKKHGKKKFAINFKIAGWITEDELAGIAQGSGETDDDYEPEETPARGRSVPAPVEEEEAPAPRRRAAAAPVEEEEEAPAPRRRAAAAPVEEEEEAPAPRRRAAAAPVEEEEEAPAPRRRAAAAPVEEEEEAPAPRRRAAAAPVEEEEEAPAPRRRAAPADKATDEAEDEGDVAPAPRGRSPGRGAPPAGNARVRRFQ